MKGVVVKFNTGDVLRTSINGISRDYSVRNVYMLDVYNK